LVDDCILMYLETTILYIYNFLFFMHLSHVHLNWTHNKTKKKKCEKFSDICCRY